MKTIAIAAALVLVSTSAMAHQPRAQRANYTGIQSHTFQKIMPNGAVRQCEVSRYQQPGRGLVRTQTCYRVR